MCNGIKIASKTVKKYIYAGLVTAFFVFLAASAAAFVFNDSNNFAPNNICVYADTLTTADNSMNSMDNLPIAASSPDTFASENRARIKFKFENKIYQYSDDIIAAPDHLIEEEIFNRKINAELSDKIRLTERCLNAGAGIKNAVLYTFPLLEKTVDKIIQDTNQPFINSEIKFTPDKKPIFYISREKRGRQVLEDRVYQDVYFALKRGLIAEINIVPRILQPEVTAEDNFKLTNLRAKFTTDYSSSCDERKNNIRLALKHVNGTVLKTDEEFSFNKTVGRRTEKRGFQKAKIIVGGEYVEGFGGGVCQASTTIYNAALLANLEITQARNHSLTPSYVPPSFDAMVNSGSSDLKFKNLGDTPVFIRSYGTDTTATVEIYGEKLPFTVKRESVTVSEVAPVDKEILDIKREYVTPYMVGGEKIRVKYGHKGIKSKGYLLYYDHHGRLIDKKLIREDVYSKSDGLIAVAPDDGNTD